MPGFTSPNVMVLNTWDSAERKYMSALLPKLLVAGYERYHEPSVIGYAMPLVAVTAGWSPAQITTSDVHLFTSILGYVHAGKPLDGLGIKVNGEPVHLEGDPLDQAARLLLMQYAIRNDQRPDVPYWRALAEDLTSNERAHIAAIRETIEKQAERLTGISYRVQSLWDHLDQVADDPHTVVVSNPPTYKGAYEKFFDTKGTLTWDAPEYEEFDAKRDIPRMVEVMEGRKALLVVQQQQAPHHAASARPVYARQLSAGQLVYLNSNRPDELMHLMGGLKVVNRKQPARASKKWPILPPDYEVTPRTRVNLLTVEGKLADAYRHEWMHRLYPTPGPGNVMILLDGYAAGVIGYSLNTISNSFARKWQKYAMLRFAFGAQHESLRLTRLSTMFSLQRSTLLLTATPGNTLALGSAEGLVTVEMTRHPEAKGLRGLMKLQDRQKHPDGYKLVYTAPWAAEATPEATLTAFLNGESKWMKARS